MKLANDGGEDMAKDACTRGLIRAICKSRPRDDEEDVEDNPECSDTEDYACNSHMNVQKVARQGTT